METNNNVVERPMLGFGEAVKICFKKYFTFTGRARRSEYWWFVLFTLLLGLVSNFIDLGLKAFTGVAFVDNLTSLAVFIPGWAVGFRRLHDVGRSGWWLGIPLILITISILIIGSTSGFDYKSIDDLDISKTTLAMALIPMIICLIMGFICLIFSLLDSHKEENKYGPSPKYQ